MIKLLGPKNFLLLFLFLAASCKKDDYPKQHPCSGVSYGNNYAMYPDLLNCRYKTGSYWVFLDSVNYSTDSVYINSFGQGMMSDICNNFEYHTFSAIAYPASDTTNYFLELGTFRKGFARVHSGITIYYNYSGTPYDSSSYAIVSNSDSMYIYDRYYYNVAKTTILVDPTEGNRRCIYYMNSMYGFLRQDILDSNNTLLSQKVLQQKNIVR